MTWRMRRGDLSGRVVKIKVEGHERRG